METKELPKQYAYLRYRDGRYKTWQPCKITIPGDVPLPGIRKFIDEDMKEQGIKYTELEITKLTNKCEE